MRGNVARVAAGAALLIASACRSTARYAVPAAAINTGAALAASARQVMSGGCIATCGFGTECNPRTGYCEPSRCGGCPAGERCAPSAEGFQCTVDGVVPRSAALRTSPPGAAPMAPILPGIGFTPQSGFPPPSPQERSDAHVR